MTDKAKVEARPGDAEASDVVRVLALDLDRSAAFSILADDGKPSFKLDPLLAEHLPEQHAHYDHVCINTDRRPATSQKGLLRSFRKKGFKGLSHCLSRTAVADVLDDLEGMGLSQVAVLSSCDLADMSFYTEVVSLTEEMSYVLLKTATVPGASDLLDDAAFDLLKQMILHLADQPDRALEAEFYEAVYGPILELVRHARNASESAFPKTAEFEANLFAALEALGALPALRVQLYAFMQKQSGSFNLRVREVVLDDRHEIKASQALQKSLMDLLGRGVYRAYKRSSDLVKSHGKTVAVTHHLKRNLKPDSSSKPRVHMTLVDDTPKMHVASAAGAADFGMTYQSILWSQAEGEIRTHAETQLQSLLPSSGIKPPVVPKTALLCHDLLTPLPCTTGFATEIVVRV